jgi:hypothetical protein
MFFFMKKNLFSALSKQQDVRFVEDGSPHNAGTQQCDACYLIPSDAE